MFLFQRGVEGAKVRGLILRRRQRRRVICRGRFHIGPSAKALNRFGVDLLPDAYNELLFKGLRPHRATNKIIQEASAELEKFGLTSTGLELDLPDVTAYLANLRGANVCEHFARIGREQVQPYLELMQLLLEAEAPGPPNSWLLAPGWTRYSHQGKVEPVQFPSGRF